MLTLLLDRQAARCSVLLHEVQGTDAPSPVTPLLAQGAPFALRAIFAFGSSKRLCILEATPGKGQFQIVAASAALALLAAVVSWHCCSQQQAALVEQHLRQVAHLTVVVSPLKHEFGSQGCFSGVLALLGSG
jgi:hypothetical protein